MQSNYWFVYNLFERLPMNLELINEILELRNRNISFTEIAEQTGLARASIVLIQRISLVYQSQLSKQLTLHNQETNHLNLQLDLSKKEVSKKEQEIKRLASLIDIDFKHNTLIANNELHNLKNELAKSKNKSQILRLELINKQRDLKNMPLIEKLKILF
jgi:predicted RNase H-like nuclease (RuvC/YqgF family)